MYICILIDEKIEAKGAWATNREERWRRRLAEKGDSRHPSTPHLAASPRRLASLLRLALQPCLSILIIYFIKRIYSD